MKDFKKCLKMEIQDVYCDVKKNAMYVYEETSKIVHENEKKNYVSILKHFYNTINICFHSIFLEVSSAVCRES